MSTVEPPVATISCKQPPLLSDLSFSKYQIKFQVKSLYLEPLVSEHLL